MSKKLYTKAVLYLWGLSDRKRVSSGDNICASKSTASRCQGWTLGVLLLKPFSDADGMVP